MVSRVLCITRCFGSVKVHRDALHFLPGTLSTRNSRFLCDNLWSTLSRPGFTNSAVHHRRPLLLQSIGKWWRQRPSVYQTLGRSIRQFFNFDLPQRMWVLNTHRPFWHYLLIALWSDLIRRDLVPWCWPWHPSQLVMIHSHVKVYILSLSCLFIQQIISHFFTPTHYSIMSELGLDPDDVAIAVWVRTCLVVGINTENIS